MHIQELNTHCWRYPIIEISWNSNDQAVFTVVCPGCGKRGPPKLSPKKAIKAWSKYLTREQ